MKFFPVAGNHLNNRQSIFLGKIKVPLVVRRAGENGASAIIHQHEIGDIQRHFMSVKRVDDFQAGIKAFLFGFFDGFLAGAGALALGNKPLQGGVLFAASSLASAWPGEMAQKLMPKRVSGRVV